MNQLAIKVLNELSEEVDRMKHEAKSSERKETLLGVECLILAYVQRLERQYGCKGTDDNCRETGRQDQKA